MLKLLLGRDWTANRTLVLSQIADDVKNGRGGRILMVPELISHDTERGLCAAAGAAMPRFCPLPALQGEWRIWWAAPRRNAWITAAGWLPWLRRPVSSIAN